MPEKSQYFPDSFYRVSIKGLCVRDGRLLLAEELLPKMEKPRWELPGGGLDFGEEIRAGFEREVEEEMGLTVTYMSEKPVYAWTYRLEKARSMEWYYTLMLAYRVEFKDLNIRPSDECRKVQFFSKDELANLGLDKHMAKLLTIFNPSDFPELET